jgi:ribosomal protein S18 acetylase RimI-like enzyme
MLTVKSALSFEGNVRRRLSELYVDGFGSQFALFSQEKDVLIKAFDHMFVLDVFHIAVLDEVIAGMGACTDGKTHSVEPKWKDLATHLGLIKGTIAYFVLRNEFHKPAIRSGPGIALIEFFVTDSNYRGKGVASAVINTFLSNPTYDEFVLEVADTNLNAFNLYKKLGFSEFARVKEKHAKESGINELIYMSYHR